MDRQRERGFSGQGLLPDDGARRRVGESGRITVLVCGLLVFLVAVIGVTASSTYVTTQQRKLLGVADAAAASAGDRIVSSGSGLRAGGGVTLDPASVRRATAEYLTELGAVDGLQGLMIESVAMEAGGVTVRVRVRATVGLPWAAALLGKDPEVIATARVRPALTR